LKLLLGFENSSNVQEIAESQNIGIDKVIETVSNAYWHGIIKLTYIPSDNDILALSENASGLLFNKTSSLNISPTFLRIVARFDGRTPFSQFVNNSSIYDKKSFLNTLGLLINSGLIQRISEEKRLVLFKECMLSHLISGGASIIGSRNMIQYFEVVCSQGSSMHPRICRIVLLKNMRVKCILEESMTPSDLDDMFDALEYFIEEVTRFLSKTIGVHTTRKLIERNLRECRLSWCQGFSEVVI
jgi:hypothetical protein